MSRLLRLLIERLRNGIGPRGPISIVSVPEPSIKVDPMPTANDDELTPVSTTVTSPVPADESQLSKNFSLEEMTLSQEAVRLGIDNLPTPEHRANLVALCEQLLEPLRAWAGPVYVSSGYRSPKLNTEIGGSKTSVHVFGLACDHRTQKSLYDEMEWWSKSGLPFDQVIYEFGRWIHVGFARPGTNPRHEMLMAFKVTDPKDSKKMVTKYYPYDRSLIDVSGTKLKET